MKKHLYEFIFFKLMGWKIIGSENLEEKKCVLMTIPHTSWHEFYICLFTRGIVQKEINWVGKKELFKFPFKYYFRYMGGESLDRTAGQNKVDAIAEIFNKKEIFRLGIFPEGTRKKVTELKTGFYYIALKANISIIPFAIDYGKKTIDIGKAFFPTGNLVDDLKFLDKHFIGVKGKNPEMGYTPKI